MEDLLEELVIQILLKLAVSDLLRCKSVCKSWLFLINKPSFIDQHIEVSKKKNPCFILNFCDRSSRYFISIVSHQTLEVSETLRVLQPSRLCIVGSCNGIVCFLQNDGIKIKDTVILWNPATRLRKIVPICYSSQIDYKIDPPHPQIGFGFDSKNNDYKVVSIHMFNYLSSFEVKVYSLKTNSWTTCSNNENFVMSELIWGACSGGMYSWMAIRKKEDGIRVMEEEVEYEVISFDMANDKLISTPLPSIISNPLSNSPTSINGSFAVISTNVSGNFDEKYSAWVLGEYGVKESWMKLFSFGSTRLRQPLALGKNPNNLFLINKTRRRSEDDLVFLDSITKQTYSFPILEHGKIVMKLCDNFTESLVPIRRM